MSETQMTPGPQPLCRVCVVLQTQRDKLLRVCTAVRGLLDVPEMLDEAKEMLRLAIAEAEQADG